MIDVNLLPEEKVTSIEQEHVKLRSVAAMLLVTAIFGVVFVAVYSYSAFLSIQKKNWEGRNAAAQEKLLSYGDLVNSLAQLKQKVAGISLIQNTRFDFPGSFTYVQKIFPAGVKLERVDLVDDGTVTFSGSSTDYSVLAGFFTKLAADPVLKNSKTSGVSMADKGSYVFSVTAHYGATSQNNSQSK